MVILKEGSAPRRRPKDDAIETLLRNRLMNGLMPKNDQTDKSLSILSGGVFDSKNEAHQSELIKQISETLTDGQMLLLTSNPDLLQTMIYILFLLRFNPRMSETQKRKMDKSRKALQKKFAERQLKETVFKTIANKLTF